jgi:hypothetical protein
MGRDNTVIGYMISGNVRDLLRRACGELKTRLYETGCSADLIAIPSMLSVVDPSAMEPRALAEVLDWLTDIEDPQYRILFAEAVPGLPRRLSRNIIAAPSCWSRDHFKFLLLKLRAAVRRREHECRAHDRKPFRLIYVLRELYSKKKVNTRELANEFSVSIRTVQRDLGLLQSLGECIDYDCASNTYSIPSLSALAVRSRLAPTYYYTSPTPALSLRNLRSSYEAQPSIAL